MHKVVLFSCQKVCEEYASMSGNVNQFLYHYNKKNTKSSPLSAKTSFKKCFHSFLKKSSFNLYIIKLLYIKNVRG